MTMTREEAIEILKREKLSLDEKYYKAIDMAIEALQARTDGDTISRQDALKPFCIAPDGTRIPEVDCDNFPVEFSVKFIRKHLLSLPSVEAEWIPCNESLPNKDGQYLVQTNWRYRGKEDFDIFSWAEGWNCYRRLDGTINRENEMSGKDFVAWRPLPTTYKKSEVEG